MSGIAERLAEVLDDHRRGESSRDCIEGIGWVWACWCDCGWHGPDREHEAHLAQALLPVVEREIAAALVRSDLGRAAYEAGRAEVVARVDEVLGRQESDGLALRSLILAALSPDPDRGEGCSCGHGWEYHGPEVPGCCECDCGVLHR